MTRIDDEQKQKAFILTLNAPSLHSIDPLVLLNHQLSPDYLPHQRITIPNLPPLDNPLHPASKCDNLMTTLFLPIYNFKALHITLSPSMEVTTGCHNAIVANNTDILRRIAILHYNRSCSAKFASGNALLKITVPISTCLPSLSRPSEVTFPMTKTLKIQKTQIIVDKTTVIHRTVKSGILDGLERVMLQTCVYHTAASLFSPFYLITIKHAFILHYEHVDHAAFTSLHLHGTYLYKLVSRSEYLVPYLVFNKTTLYSFSNL